MTAAAPISTSPHKPSINILDQVANMKALFVGFIVENGLSFKVI